MEQEFKIVVHTDGLMSFPVYCLKTDSWNDYQAFMEDAEAAIKSDNMRNANRFLRAALTCMFSQVEGVVNDIDSQLPKHSRDSLWNRMRNIEREAKKYGSIPCINIQFEKVLRDLVAHPGIKKDFSERDSEPEILDQGSVFDKLSIDTLRNLERQISSWLDAVCTALNVERFTDFEQSAEAAEVFLREAGCVEIKSKDV